MKTKKWTCASARNICIVRTLAKSGHFPTRKSEKEAWFLSPLRQEKQPSFKVSIALNRWYDFGIGKGGNVIDLVCLITNCSVKEALAYLSDGLHISSFLQHKEVEHQKKRKLKENKVLSIKPIEHYKLIGYLHSRKIPIEVANIYCREIWYECNNRKYYALGLQNHLGGWELRNSYIKSSTSPKSYSFFNKGNPHLLILEGMFDMLSMATMFPENILTSDLLILNSLSFIPQALSILENYGTVSLCLDRDPSGKKATADILSTFPKSRDRSEIYVGFKDLNEKLVKNHRLQ